MLDTAGQEQYRSLQDMSAQSGEGFVIVYDVCAKESLVESRRLLGVVAVAHEQDEVPPPCVLVGNKVDLEGDEHYGRKITLAEAAGDAEQFGAEHYETSAKLNVKVERVFHQLVRGVLQRRRLIHAAEVAAEKQRLKEEEEAQKAAADAAAAEAAAQGCCSIL